MRAGSLPSMLCFLNIEDGGRVAVIYVPPWYVCPRTHITSDMCTPGRDTQNTEALYPGLLRLQGKHGGYEGQILWVYILKFQPIQNINGNWFWLVSSQTTALTGQGYQFCYDHRSDPNVSQNVCLPLRLWVLFWNVLLIRNCTRLDRPRIRISLQSPFSDMIYQTISGDTHITEQRSQWRLSSINLE